MREAIKSHGQSTPLNAPTVKRRTRCDVCIRHLCGEARRHSTIYNLCWSGCCRYIGNRLRNESVKTVDSFGQLYFIGLHEVCGQSVNTRGIGTMTT